MTSEPLLLTLLYAVAAVAVIGAINARDLMRLAISSVLALFCLGAAVFHTARYLAHQSTTMDDLTSTDQASTLPPDTTRTTSNSGQSSAPAQSPVNSDLRNIADTAQHLRDELVTVDLSRVSQMSDAEYLRMQSRTEVYAAEARDLRDRATGLAAKPPAGWEESVKALNNASKSLAEATGELQGFFKAGSDDEEKARSASFRKWVQAASAALEKIDARLIETAASNIP